jgi:hypothetical protein
MILSLAAGIGIGIIDAVGFYYTAAIFLHGSAPNKKAIAGGLELLRLLVLIAAIVVLNMQKGISIVPLLIAALFISLGGKMVLIFKRLRA